MDHNHIKDQITSILSDIVERAATLNEGRSQDTLIDLDLALEDTRRLYRLLHELRHFTGSESDEQVSENHAVDEAVDDAVDEAVDETVDEKEMPRGSDDNIREEEEIPPSDPAPETPLQEEKEEQKPPRQIIDVLGGKANQVVADLFSEEDNSLHSRMSGMREDRSIGTRMQRKPIASLREGIGVNEKFLFINELFDGNIQAYNDAITRLNGMNTAAEAFEYLNELTRTHKWEAGRSSATIEMLANYVQRRFLEK